MRERDEYMDRRNRLGKRAMQRIRKGVEKARKGRERQNDARKNALPTPKPLSLSSEKQRMRADQQPTDSSTSHHIPGSAASAVTVAEWFSTVCFQWRATSRNSSNICLGFRKSTRPLAYAATIPASALASRPRAFARASILLRWR